MKRILYFLVLILGCSSCIFAQQNAINPELKLVNTSSYSPVQVGDVWSGVDEGTEVEVTITVTPRSATGISSDNLSEERYSHYIVTRKYNNETKPLNKNVSEDRFTPNVGVNQTVTYVASIYFEKRIRTNAESEDWGEWAEQEPEVTEEVTTTSFNLYAPPYVYLDKLEAANTNTCVDGPERLFSVDIDSSTGNPDGWTINWQLDDSSVSSESSYAYNPTGAIDGKKVLKAIISNKAPDNTTEWYTYTDPIELQVYKHPSTATISYIEPNVNGSCTYVGKDCEYKASIANANDYGEWIYEWKNKNQEIPNSSDSIYTIEEKGEYSISLGLRCVNPSNPSEVWYSLNEDKVFSYITVFDDPHNAVLEYVFPTGAKANTFLGRAENEQVYTVDIPNEENYGSWVYVWERKWDDQNSKIYKKDARFTPDVETTYSTTLTVLCTNPNVQEEEWLKIEKTDIPNLKVFANPADVSPEYSYPQGKDNASCIGRNCAREYSVNIGDNANNGHYGTWIYEWKRDGKTVSSSYNANIPSSVEAGTYTTSLTLKCVNPDDANDVWRNVDVPTFGTYTVYTEPKKPEIDKDDKMWVKVNNSYKDFTFKVNNTGNPKGWTYKWNNVEDSTYHVDVSTTTFPNYLTVKGEWKNVNPLDPSEIWLEDSESFKVYICPDFDSPDITIPSSNFVITVDSVPSFKVSAPAGLVLPTGWRWDYSWHSSTQQDAIGVSSQLDYDAKNDAGKKPEITCTLTGYTEDNEMWFDPETLNVATLEVYAKPDYEEKDIHYDVEASQGTRNYTIFLGQTINTDNLYVSSGGYDSGWEGHLSVDGNPQEGLSFTPSSTGSYNLQLSVVNNATLTTGEKKKWYDNGSLNYKLTVLEKPDTTTNLKEWDEMEDLHVLKGENINITVNSLGGDASGWDISWTLTSTDPNFVTKTGTGNVDVTLDNNTSLDSLKYTLSYVIKNTPSEIVKDNEYKALFEKNFFVWKDITATVDNLKKRDDDYYVLETCEGLWPNNKEQVTLSSVGGDANKWILEWTPEEDTSENISFLPHGRSLNTDFDNLKAAGEVAKEYRYAVTAKYNNGGAKAQTVGPFKVAIITWPKPELKDITVKLKDKPKTNTKDISYQIGNGSSAGTKSVNIDCYNNDEIQVFYTLVGGKFDKKDLWNIEYNGIKSTIPYTIGVPLNHEDTKLITASYFGSQESRETSHRLKFTHKYDGTFYTSNPVWYESDLYEISLKTYASPEHTPSLTDSTTVKWKDAKKNNTHVDIYAGGFEENKVKMVYSHKNGRNDGWHYEWFIDSEKQSTNLDQWTYIPAVSSPYEDKTIKVHVINDLPDGNKGIDTTYVYPIRVWQKAEFANNFSLTDANQQNRDITNGAQAIRTGNTLKGSVPAIRYGYNNSSHYKYEWSGSYAYSSGPAWSYVINNLSGSTTKAHETLAYKLKMTNIGPSEKVWDGVAYSQNIEVYNRPATPTSLVQKGNGTSRTMIALASISDQDLEGRDYYLVFGYTDTAGKDHDFASQKQVSPGQVRWSTQFENQQQMSNAYVYAVWKYENAEVTSGKRTLTGVDEAYDSSTYNGSTRAAISGDDYDIIKDVHSSRKIRKVYSLDGTLMGSTLTGLKAGLYIVEFADGVINKVNVK